jgi:putative N6-adenine-specific DNA methylase
MFDGKMRDYRADGGVVKTDEEKRQMAEKHRFKKERDFKKRLNEQEENEDGDIRSFKFHSLERKEPRKPREPREPRDFRNPREGRDSRDARKPRDFKKGKDFKKGFNKDLKKPFKKNNDRRFDDEADN